MSYVLILEDDPTMAEWLQGVIQREFGMTVTSVELLETESEFRLRWVPEFDAGRRLTPACIVIDVMLRWTDPAPDQPVRPLDVVEGGHIRAGFRCQHEIMRHPRLRGIPVTLFTSLTPEECQRLGFDLKGVDLVNKDDGQRIVYSLRRALMA